MRRIPLAIFFALLALAPLCAQAVQVSIGATRDSTVFSENNNSEGASYDLFAGRNNSGSTGTLRRSFIYFDVDSVIPDGSVVNSVSLTMRSTGAPSSQFPVNVSLHRVLEDWGTGSSGAGAGNGGMSGGMAGGASTGFAPTAGEVTWDYQFWNTDAWTTPGGHFAATPSATMGIDYFAVFTTWSTASLVSDVQAWVDDPSSNFGWAIIGDESFAGSMRRFTSSETPATAPWSADWRPVLQVEYTLVPEPATVSLSLAAIAGLAMCWFRRCRK